MFNEIVWHMGTSAVKHTTPLPCIGLSESDSKLYTNFKFCEGKNHENLEKHVDLQSHAIYVDNKIQEKSPYFRRSCN